jgi:hypothetical protein
VRERLFGLHEALLRIAPPERLGPCVPLPTPFPVRAQKTQQNPKNHGFGVEHGACITPIC